MRFRPLFLDKEHDPLLKRANASPRTGHPWKEAERKVRFVLLLYLNYRVISEFDLRVIALINLKREMALVYQNFLKLYQTCYP